MALQKQEYAVHANYALIRKYVDADENLIHISILAKIVIFGPNMGQLGSVFNFECSSGLVSSILKNR